MSFAVGAAERYAACGDRLLGVRPDRVEGWALGEAPFLRAIGHGAYDPVIPIEFAHRSLEQLHAAGAEVLYHESPMDHAIDPAFVAELVPWLAEAVRAPAEA
jgi:predicted esterase